MSKRTFLSAALCVLLFASGCLLGRFLPTETAPPAAPLEPARLALPKTYLPSPGSLETAQAGTKTYLLMFEEPARRSQLDTWLTKNLAESRSRRDPAYEKILSDLGVSAENSAQIREHVWKVYRASMELEAMQKQYLKAQSDYDSRMREFLGEEKYLTYRQFEESKLIDYEYKGFTAFLEKSSTQIPGDASAVLRKLIGETKAYTHHFIHGPYDGMPEVGLGRETAILRIEKDIVRIEERAADLLARATAAGLSGDIIKAVSGYYADRRATLESKITRIKNPGPRFMADLRFSPEKPSREAFHMPAFSNLKESPPSTPVPSANFP